MIAKLSVPKTLLRPVFFSLIGAVMYFDMGGLWEIQYMIFQLDTSTLLLYSPFFIIALVLMNQVILDLLALCISKPILEICDEGLIDRRLFKKKIPWSDVEWSIYEKRRGPWVQIVILKNERTYVRKRNIVNLLLGSVSRLLGSNKNTYTIDHKTLSVSLDDIIRALQSRKPKRATP